MSSYRWSRDDHGIPRVEADDLVSLHEGMGYCHATDRGMQMLIMRILGQGRAAELLDASDEMVEVDRFFRRKDFGSGLFDEVEKLDPEVFEAVIAYCRGVNARFDEKVPWEFKLVRYRPEPWTPQDCLMLARMTGYLTLAQSQGEVERLLVEMVQAGIDDARLAELFPGSTEGLDRDLLEKVSLRERVVPESVQWAASSARMMASNNWCVSGDHTASGAAMLANDPHLEINRLPNVWVEMSFQWGDDWATLVTMPGLPSPLVGRTRHLSWGATYTFMDAIDSWVEEVRDGKVRRGDEWAQLERRTETIKRRKGTDLVEQCWHSSHGLLDGDASKDGFYLATRWSGSAGGAPSVNGIYKMWTANTAADGMQAFGDIEPSFSWIFADSEGNIGYQMSGRMPVRPDDWNGLAPRPGWDSTYDWNDWVPAEDLPRVHNPASGIIVTANNDLNHLGNASPINMPMGDHRARRIDARLRARDDHDVETFRAIQLDDYSLQAAAFCEVLAPLLGDHALDRAISDWDYRYTVDSTGPTAFENFYTALQREMFGPDCGTAVIRHLQERTGIFIDFYGRLDAIFLAEDSAWLADRTREEVWTNALEAARTQPLKPWGHDHRVTLTNMFFGGKLPNFLGFDVGPLPLPGGRSTPFQMQIYRAGERLTSFAPTLRFVADMADDVLHTMLCGGPSDRRFSPWYTNGVERWLNGKFIERAPKPH